MALKQRGSEEITTKEFNLHAGVIKYKVIAINPNKQEMKDILGIDSPEEPVYVREGKEEGTKQYLMYFWLGNLPYIINNPDGTSTKVAEDEFRLPLIFGISDQLGESKDGTKKLFINKFGESIYAESIDFIKENYEWFSSEGLRQAYLGESGFYDFHKYYANLKMSRNEKDENCLGTEDIKQLFTNDKFFKDHIKGLMSTNHTVYCVTGIKNNGVDDNGNVKVREVLYNQYYQKGNATLTSAISNFKSYINADKVTKNQADTKERRTPRMEYFSYEPQIFNINEAVEKVVSSVDKEADNDSYTQTDEVTF